MEVYLQECEIFPVNLLVFETIEKLLVEDSN